MQAIGGTNNRAVEGKEVPRRPPVPHPVVKGIENKAETAKQRIERAFRKTGEELGKKQAKVMLRIKVESVGLDRVRKGFAKVRELILGRWAGEACE